MLNKSFGVGQPRRFVSFLIYLNLNMYSYNFSSATFRKHSRKKACFYYITCDILLYFMLQFSYFSYLFHTSFHSLSLFFKCISLPLSILLLFFPSFFLTKSLYLLSCLHHSFSVSLSIYISLLLSLPRHSLALHFSLLLFLLTLTHYRFVCRIEKAKIMIANTPMDTDKIKIYGSRVSTAQTNG